MRAGRLKPPETGAATGLLYCRVPGGVHKMRRARMPRLGHPRPVCYYTLRGLVAGSEPRGAELLQVQVHGSRRVFGPLFPETRGNFLALLGHGEACHDGCDGYETDTQGANKRLPRGGWERRVGRG